MNTTDYHQRITSMGGGPLAIEHFEERAAIAEYCGGLSRERAESIAMDQTRVLMMQLTQQRLASVSWSPGG